MSTHVLFAGNRYYPKGGRSNLQEFGTVDELKAYFIAEKEDIANESYIGNWGHIVRLADLQVVEVCEDWDGFGDPVWEPADA